jgi:hypothetical protein
LVIFGAYFCGKYHAKMHVAGVKEHCVPTLHHLLKLNLLVGSGSLKVPLLGSVLALSDTLYPCGDNLSERPTFAVSRTSLSSAATKSIMVGPQDVPTRVWALRAEVANRFVEARIDHQAADLPDSCRLQRGKQILPLVHTDIVRSHLLRKVHVGEAVFEVGRLGSEY